MSRSKKVLCDVVQRRVGHRKSVRVIHRLEDPEAGPGCFVLRFQTPIQKKDFQQGLLRPMAFVERRKTSLFTSIAMSEEAALALAESLNELLP